MAILVIGSSNTDLVAHAKSLPKPGETILGGEFFVNPGGKGANQAVGAARVGKDVTFCCMTGEDDYGKAAKALFEKEGIDTSYVLSTPEAPSGVALITVDEKAENCIVVASGANLKLTPEVVDGIKDFASYDIVLAQLETPMDTIEHIGDLAKKNGVKFVLNPAPAAKLSEKLLSCIDIITPNETEAEIITGVHIDSDESALAAAKCMHDMGVGTVIITLGSRGSLVSDAKGSRFVPAFKVKAVDTTAAGDIFNGSLCVALSEGKDIDEAVRFASATASIAVTRRGAQASAPYREEVEKVLNNQ
ncbi:MAG: ribokinase [Bacteroidales bacterium]|nr:ribokinase [Candidatus Cryptobacteroides caccocaballi]